MDIRQTILSVAIVGFAVTGVYCVYKIAYPNEIFTAQDLMARYGSAATQMCTDHQGPMMIQQNLLRDPNGNSIITATCNDYFKLRLLNRN